MTLTLHPLQATHIQKVKVKGQSAPKIEYKQSEGWTDGDICITSVANAVAIMVCVDCCRLVGAGAD